MATVIVLDTNALGLACQRRGKPEADQFQSWSIQARANGSVLVIPEVADYEVRRGLLLDQRRAEKRGQSHGGIDRLNGLRVDMHFAPVTREVMLKAAELWADVRSRGLATADDKKLDGDAIIAAQALLYVGAGDSLVVATTDDHLSRFDIDARPWRRIDV